MNAQRISGEAVVLGAASLLVLALVPTEALAGRIVHIQKPQQAPVMRQAPARLPAVQRTMPPMPSAVPRIPPPALRHPGVINLPAVQKGPAMKPLAPTLSTYPGGAPKGPVGKLPALSPEALRPPAGVAGIPTLRVKPLIDTKGIGQRFSGEYGVNPGTHTVEGEYEGKYDVARPESEGASPGHYTTRTDEEGTATIQFGDGEPGAQPPSGRDNVATTYGAGGGEGGDLESSPIQSIEPEQPQKADVWPRLEVEGVLASSSPDGDDTDNE